MHELSFRPETLAFRSGRPLRAEPAPAPGVDARHVPKVAYGRERRPSGRATGGVVNPDEAITVASALQYGGWRTVLGTLWPVQDGVAAHVSRSVHQAVLGDAVPPHRAVHDAVIDQREWFPDHPSAWAPFVHIGV